MVAGKLPGDSIFSSTASAHQAVWTRKIAIAIPQKILPIITSPLTWFMKQLPETRNHQIVASNPVPIQRLAKTI
jgi:hypothetical protein